MAERLLALVMTGLLTGCAGTGADEEPRLRLAGGGDPHPVVLGIPRVPQGESWVVRGVTLCVDEGPAPVAVVAVRGVGSDLAVEDFSLRPWSPDAGPLETDRRGTLIESGFDPARKSAGQRCSRGEGDELAVQVTNPHAGVGVSAGFEVVYRSGDHERTVHVPFGVRLCPHRSAAVAACRAK